METQYKKGDRVFDLVLGWGVVSDVDDVESNLHPIGVSFDCGNYNTYARDGKLVYSKGSPSLSFTEYTPENGGAIFERPIERLTQVYWIECNVVKTARYNRPIPGMKNRMHELIDVRGNTFTVTNVISTENPLNVKQNQ